MGADIPNVSLSNQSKSKTEVQECPRCGRKIGAVAGSKEAIC